MGTGWDDTKPCDGGPPVRPIPACAMVRHISDKQPQELLQPPRSWRSRRYVPNSSIICILGIISRDIFAHPPYAYDGFVRFLTVFKPIRRTRPSPRARNRSPTRPAARAIKSAYSQCSRARLSTSKSPQWYLYQRREFLTRGGLPFCSGCDSRVAKEIRHVSMHCSSG